jgi:hypothetical protein
LKRIVALILVLGLLLPSAALATSSTTVAQPVAVTSAFAKTKFVFDLGTAAFAIHHFIYLPYKKDHIKGIFAKIKAALAAAFAYNRLKAAYTIAQSGDSKLLKAIVSPLSALITEVKTISAKIKGGDISAVPSANSALSTLSSAAQGAGVPFKDLATSL